MSELDGPFRGQHGTAERVPRDYAKWARASETLCEWLIDAPGHTPAWSKYLLCAVRLRDVPDRPPPIRHFDGATHEILILALNPDYPVTVEAMLRPDFQLRWLEPHNLAYQVEATDEEVRDVVALMAQAIAVHGFAPEPWLGRQSFTDYWAETIVKTLAHARGEAHAP